MDDRLASSYPLLTMLAVAVSAWLMKKQENEADRQLHAGEGDDLFLGMKLAAASYYDNIVEEALGLRWEAMGGAQLLYRVPEDAFAT